MKDDCARNDYEREVLRMVRLLDYGARRRVFYWLDAMVEEGCSGKM